MADGGARAVSGAAVVQCCLPCSRSARDHRSGTVPLREIRGGVTMDSLNPYRMLYKKKMQFPTDEDDRLCEEKGTSLVGIFEEIAG